MNWKLHIESETTYTLVADDGTYLARWYDKPVKSEITLDEATEIILKHGKGADVAKFVNMYKEELTDDVLFKIWKSQI